MSVPKRFKDLQVISTPLPGDYFVGTRDMGYQDSDGNLVYQDYLYIPLVAGLTKKLITVDNVLANEITDSFFSNQISEIVTGKQTYLLDESFTQSGITITGIDLQFFVGQKILVKI